MSFKNLGLRADLLRAIEEQGYEDPTPVQERAIPALLEGRDVLAGAQTGTGKTAAFALPILQKLSPEPGKRARKAGPPRALILTPTRELALQVAESFQTYGSHTKLKVTVVYGGVGLEPQTRALKAGTDVLVATPGRLLDHVERRNADLSKVEMFVLDEGDRMLDMGFIDDIRRVMRLLPKERQNMLFSATYSNAIRRLAEGFLVDPETIDVAPRNTAAERVRQIAHPVENGDKQKMLLHLINDRGWSHVLVFTRTKHRADRVARQLSKAGVKATAIHGDKAQTARQKALNAFKDKKIDVLVATDVASRGIDIDNLPVVLNFDLPDSPEDYVHRIGRTGRAGQEGVAHSLVAFEQDENLKAIERLLGRPLEVEEIEGFKRTLALPDAHRRGTSGKRHTPGTRKTRMKGSRIARAGW